MVVITVLPGFFKQTRIISGFKLGKLSVIFGKTLGVSRFAVKRRGQIGSSPEVAIQHPCSVPDRVVRP